MLTLTELSTLLNKTMSKANIALFAELIQSFFTVRYTTTTRSLSRYTTYSLRQIFRFLKQSHDWLSVRILLFGQYIFHPDRHYLAAIDEVVEGKSGKSSYGKATFYSSCAQKPIASVCFFSLSLIDVVSGTSFMLHCLQVVHTEEDKKRIAGQKQKRQAGKARSKENTNLAKGRKKGSQNKTSPAQDLSASQRTFQALWQTVWEGLHKYLPACKPTHLVADCAYGTLYYLCAALQYQCFLISKMKSNAVFYLPYQGTQKGKRPKVYGDKVNLKAIDKAYLKKTNTNEKGWTQQIYQFQAYNKTMGSKHLLNVVVQITTHKNRQVTNIWFSNDLNLAYDKLLEYYALRFQIEFDFRDAKQHFGLSDFKNYKEKNLTNFVQLIFTVVLLSKIIRLKYREKYKNPSLSILDLKIITYAQYTAKKVIQLCNKKQNTFLFDDFYIDYMPEDTINPI